MAKTNLTTLCNDIQEYINTGNIEFLRKYVGKIKGAEPFDEPDLGTAINDGDFGKVAELVSRYTTFSDTDNTTPSYIEEDLKQTAADTAAAGDTKTKKEYLETLKKTADDNKKLIGGSKKAAADSEKYKQAIKDIGKKAAKEAEKDKEYLKKKAKAIETFKNKLNNPEQDKKQQEAKQQQEQQSAPNTEKSEKSIKIDNGVNFNMNITRKDLNNIMSTLKTINKHFAEDEAEVVDEKPAANDDKVVKVNVVEIDDSIRDLIKDAAMEAHEQSDENFSEYDDVADDNEIDYDEEIESGDYSDDDDAVTDENFSEFYDFANTIVDSINSIVKAQDKISKQLDEASKTAIKTFSQMDNFSTFAAEAVGTINNIASRVHELSASKPSEPVTKNLTKIKDAGDNYEQEFIHKADDKKMKAEDVAIDNKLGMSIDKIATFSENVNKKDADRYNKVKDFLSSAM